MVKILSKLGNPHKKLRCVHIAGTKGKGSTATMLSHMIENCGYRVGLYTSPHILNLRERVMINHRMISESQMTRCIAKVAPVVEEAIDDCCQPLFGDNHSFPPRVASSAEDFAVVFC